MCCCCVSVAVVAASFGCTQQGVHLLLCYLCQQHLELVVARLQLLNNVLLLILRCLRDKGCDKHV
jgi:hypothetical protein